MDASLVFVHLLALLSILVPIYFFVKIYRHSKDEFTGAFLGVLLGFAPLVLYSLVEVLDELGMVMLPPEESLVHQAIMHGAEIIAFLTFALFLNWFDKKFVEPFYGGSRPSPQGQKRK